ncbi:MAG: 16S rRNA (cytosine(967)-C(5))-methyltransferase RsmB [Clostridia bacterium]|nr:16S rRNA (cytosine(967)-C(5))-methyltransferase RsmB [Clostridia bacterium]
MALYALQDVNRFDAYAQLALDKRLRESRLSPDDRRLATSIFYQAVENRLNIEYVLNAFVNAKPDPAIEDILHIACAQILFMDKIPPHAAVDEAVKQARAIGKDEATGFVNGVLRNLLRAKEGEGLKYPDENEDKVKYLSVKYSVCEVILHRLINAYGVETAEKIVSFRPAERTETIRPNLMKRDFAQFEEYLNKRGWAWKKGVVEGAYLISHAGNLAGDPDFFDGEFSIQGESSMLSAMAVNARPGMTVIDVCAAPGGKSALMCEMMKGTGRVHAWDVHPHRVELLKAMGKRLKLDNLRAAARDASVAKEEFYLSADAVLIDAPCSGVGVMTDKPDLKYRVTDESIASLIDTQKKILKASSQYVKRGGVLVYSTCSILPEENEKQIEAFLFDHPEFKLDLDDRWVPDALKNRFMGGMLSLLPNRDGVEGFFIARMRRVDV